MPVCANRLRNGLAPVLTKAILHQAKAAAMCTAGRDHACPPPPIPPFLLAQNPSSKWVVPTDNMQGHTQNTADARALHGHTTFVRTSMQNAEATRWVWGHAPADIFGASQVISEAILGHIVTLIQEH